MKASAQGFTLVELMVTLAILGLLATMVLPMAQTAVQRRKEQELRTSLRDIRDAIDRYKQAYDDGKLRRVAGSSGYPPTLELLETGLDDVKSPSRQKIRFLRRIPRDPFYDGDSGISNADTWGKRSFASEADQPKEGVDVFDIYSLSPLAGLNKVPYAKW